MSAITEQKEWDDEQNKVWETVLAYTKLIMQGKVEEFLKYFHEDYTGWNNVEPIPADKQSIMSELNSEFPRNVIDNYSIIPSRIKVHDGIAIVHYYLGNKYENQEILNTNNVKHFTDVLVKNNGHWVLIADHFGVRNKRDSKN